MSINQEIAKLFDEMSKMLQLTGANRFRVIAYENLARVLRDHPSDLATLADSTKNLTSIEGIGDGSAKKIIEYIKTGHISDHQDLSKKVPRGLLDVMAIPGVGPKTVTLMWKEANVVDLASLQLAMDAGTIEALPRMGKKAVQNIRDSLAFAAKASERTQIGKALPIAEAIVEQLRTVKGAARVEYAGSLRRGCETIGDIDILASTEKPDDLFTAFTSLGGVEKVLASGGTKASVRMAPGIQVDLRIVPVTSFGAALMYFTGSKEHNIRLRERAIKSGLRLNEYGLYKDDEPESDETPQARGLVPIAADEEASVYRAFDLPWIPPELREMRGEFEVYPPTLIELPSIGAELHAHTTASDGRLSIDELIQEAKSRGFHTLAITDHSKSSVQADGLDEGRLREHIKTVRRASNGASGIQVLIGSEVDILTDGALDYDDELLAELDLVVASPHAALTQDSRRATDRLIKAIEHPLVRILGHPTGRIIGRRDGLPIDIAEVAAAAAQHDTALEINAHYHRLDLRDTHVRVALEAGCLIAINTDAHAASDFDNLRYGVLTGRRGGLTADRCINTWSAAKLCKWIADKG